MPHALLCDTYLLTVAQGLFNQQRHRQPAVSYAFTRRAPFHGAHTTVVGLHHLIDQLRGWRFEADDLDYLASLCYPDGNPRFTPDFLSMLAALRFEGTLHALPEGSILWPNAPILTLEAPIVLCQLLETLIINSFSLPSLVATQAARVVASAQGDPVAEFGLRRAQGMEAGMIASRAACIGGVHATSNTEAGKRYGLPVSGTVSHSWLLSFATEQEAFQATADLMGNNTVLLVDTFQTEQGVRHAIKTAHAMAQQGQQLQGIRLDSGDLGALSRMARNMLDAAGLHQVKIMASGDLDAHRIQALKAQHAPIDQWGVGTRLATAFEQPALDIAYKLSAVHTDAGWIAKRKHSDTPAKATLPGKPQLWRQHTEQGITDTVYDALSESISSLPQPGATCLQCIHHEKKWTYTVPNTQAVCDYAAMQREQLTHKKHVMHLSPTLSKAVASPLPNQTESA